MDPNEALERIARAVAQADGAEFPDTTDHAAVVEVMIATSLDTALGTIAGILDAAGVALPPFTRHLSGETVTRDSTKEHIRIEETG